jgi:hypothetical protein
MLISSLSYLRPIIFTRDGYFLLSGCFVFVLETDWAAPFFSNLFHPSSYFSRSAVGVPRSEILRCIIVIWRHRSKHFSMALNWREIIWSGEIVSGNHVLFDVNWAREHMSLLLLGNKTTADLLSHLWGVVRGKNEWFGVGQVLMYLILILLSFNGVWIAHLGWLLNLKALARDILVESEVLLRHGVYADELSALLEILG